MKSVWVQGILAILLCMGVNTYLLLKEMDKALAYLNSVILEEKREELPRFWSFRSREIEKLVVDLRNQKQELRKRDMEAKQMEAYIAGQQKELEKLKGEIEKIRMDLTKKLVVVEKNEQKNLGELAATYTNLDPTAAVTVFNEMDDVFVVKILSSMDPAVVAPIFQAMVTGAGNKGFSAQRVAKISELMRLKQQEPGK